MNMPPDDATLALWLEDELDGEDFANVEAWAQSQPDQLAMRESARKWKAMINSGIPATEEPPYADFFNARIARSIREQQFQQSPQAKSASVIPFWKKFTRPLAACAGMALTFWLGIHSRSIPVVDEIAEIATVSEINQLAGAGDDLPAMVYTPVNGVSAEYFDSDDAAATVVILEGVAAIPDTVDLTKQTADNESPREIDATANAELPTDKAANP
ncbi:MAG: hypothetical protein ACO3F7_06375 [Luteolibacter sp.]